MRAVTLFTVGHGNHSAATLLELLTGADVGCLVDVRASPRSKRNPQFDRARLERDLPAAGIAYRWLGDALGGFRRPKPASPNTALAEPGFRGFADHMATQVFADALASLMSLGRTTTVAIMCAEVDYRGCHRQFIADALSLAGAEVLHLRPGQAALTHTLHPALDPRREPPVYNTHAQGDLFA